MEQLPYSTLVPGEVAQCWNTSVQVKTRTQNEWSVTNKIGYIGFRQGSYLNYILYIVFIIKVQLLYITEVSDNSLNSQIATLQQLMLWDRATPTPVNQTSLIADVTATDCSYSVLLCDKRIHIQFRLDSSPSESSSCIQRTWAEDLCEPLWSFLVRLRPPLWRCWFDRCSQSRLTA